MNDVKLTDYFPAVDEISTDTLSNVRSRIETYLRSRYSESIDMSSNSVFGDLILGPLSYLIASFEIAASRLFSDIDLANVAEGQIYNCDFVSEYLDNFGLSQRVSTPATGVVRISFIEPGEYVLDASTSFVFNVSGKDYVFAIADVTDFITIKYNLDEGEETANVKQLNRLDESEYVVNIPVVGPAGIEIAKNTDCATNITIPQVQEVISITDFDPGTLPENVMELANKTRNTYYAASLSSRNGCLSFLLQSYPELRGVSPVVSGDAEIHRTTENLFGVKQGVMDIFIKSKRNFVTDYSNVPLAFNSTLGRWIGLFPTPQGPPVRITDVRLADSTVAPESFEIAAKTNDRDKFPGLSSSYSPNEIVGLYVEETNSTNADGVADANFASTPASITPTETTVDNIGIVEAFGEFVGHPFISGRTRNITVNFRAYDSTFQTLYGSISNDNTVVEVEFAQQSIANNITTYNLVTTEDYNRFCKGVNYTVKIDSGSIGLQDKLDLLLLPENNSHIFQVKPTSTNFLVTYEYDPTILAVDSFVSRGDIKPINTDLQVRNFLPCKVTNITITYRSKSGSLVDLNNARTDILSYVNGLSYPNLYESFAIAEIMLYYGADGVKTITQLGEFSRSIADKYLDSEKSVLDVIEGNLFIDQMASEYVDAYDLVEKIETTTLQAPEGFEGIGERNIQYILEAGDIVFDEVSF